MIHSVSIHTKFIDSVWFQNIFHLYNTVFFFRYNKSQSSILSNNIINLIKNKLDYKVFHANSSLRRLKYFGFLSGSFLIVYTNDFSSINIDHLNGFYLFALNHYGYFVNPSYLSKINIYHSFYNKNYLFIISNLLWFSSILNTYIFKLIYSLVLQVGIIFNYFVGSYKVLLPLLTSNLSKNIKNNL